MGQQVIQVESSLFKMSTRIQYFLVFQKKKYANLIRISFLNLIINLSGKLMTLTLINISNILKKIKMTLLFVSKMMKSMIRNDFVEH
jgi:hypothetical protein